MIGSGDGGANRMGRTFVALALIPVLASCSYFSNPPPMHTLDNACSILEDKWSYGRAFRAAKRKWDVPIHVQMAAIQQESGFRARAKPPRTRLLGFIPWKRESSAFGYAQALDGTWKQYKAETRSRFSRRSSIRDAADFMGWYMSRSSRRLGISLSDARSQYLAYHEGWSGYARGAHRSKPWLLRTADEVGQRARRYKSQLSNCRAARRGWFG